MMQINVFAVTADVAAFNILATYAQYAFSTLDGTKSHPMNL